MKEMETIFSLRPIIGNCTEVSIIIVCETFTAHSFSLEMTNMIHPSIVFEIQVNTRPDIVEQVVIEDIDPGHYYATWIEEGKTVYSHSINYNIAPRSIVLFSGDLPEADTNVPLWASIRVEMPDLIVHLGDNIHADEVFKELERMGHQRSQRKEDIRRDQEDDLLPLLSPIQGDLGKMGSLSEQHLQHVWDQRSRSWW